METDITQRPEAVFRPIKRRKFLRKRLDGRVEGVAPEQNNTSDSEKEKTVAEQLSLVLSDDSRNGEPQLANPMHLRKAHRVRRGGIEFFSAIPKQKADVNRQSSAGMTLEDMESENIQAMFDRFTAHTGQKVDLDKHMMEYIESEMAERQRRSKGAEVPVPTTNTMSGSVLQKSNPNFPQREPACLGKLHEIDLGQEAKLQNIARTEAATRRLAGNESPSPEEESSLSTIRLGRDGKPSRSRRRRNSEDVERDKLVEEVLRESKLDVYDEPESNEPGDDQAADDRIAEQFRRDFLEAIQSRRRGARPRNNKVTKPDVPRGPKLGGSRSARAAMREMQEKSAQK